jgi:transcriptional regulator with XRE-family HTH domain
MAVNLKITKGMNMSPKGRGGGKTPARVTELIIGAVSASSFKAVSLATGLGVSVLSRYSKGVGEPTQDTLEKLAKYFGVTVSELRGQSMYVGSDDAAKCIDQMSQGLKALYDIMTDDNELVLLKQVTTAFQNLLPLLRNSMQETESLGELLSVLYKDPDLYKYIKSKMTEHSGDRS